LQESEIKGIQRACKYSFITNKKEYCGKKNSFKFFKEFILNPEIKRIKRIEKLLMSFNGFYPYLKLIGESNSLNPFNEKVVEAYWTGNNLLENIPLKSIKKMILNDFVKAGLPKKIAEKKALNLKKKVFPHHSFHVLYINFISRKVLPILENLNNCIVLWGKVVKEEKENLKVKGEKLFLEKGKLRFDKSVIMIKKGFVQENVLNKFVSFHWNFGVEVLNKKQLKNLKKFSLKNLELVNSII
jgi:hypothetical protein